MKKLTAFFGAILLGFVLVSCTNNPKESILKDIDTFFDQEVATLNGINTADDMVAYLEAYDGKIDEFAQNLDNKYPVTDDNIFVGMSKEEDDAIMAHLDERYDGLWNIINEKGGQMMEPYIVNLESIVEGLMNDIENGVTPNLDEALSPILDAYDNIEKYSILGTEEQYERFSQADEIIYHIYGLDEEE